jgi:hypothetical protein
LPIIQGLIDKKITSKGTTAEVPVKSSRTLCEQLNPIIGYYTGALGEADILPIIQDLLKKKRTNDELGDNDLEVVDSEFPESTIRKKLKPIVC